ncbi:hypothetical protein CJJ07_005331 [Candidozyma auris]|nr:hypothetical protein CJJ07_005331 [[Candida] auris]QRG40408.1 hypothetical protein FDK38_004878 [[Candida] auris]
MVIHPVVTWAQRSNETEADKNLLFLTIEVQDPQDTKIELTSDALRFSAKSPNGLDTFELNLEFFAQIDPKNSHWNEAGNHISFIIRKAEAQAEYWPRLLKEKLKLHYIKTDFDKWVDEDEQDDQNDDSNLDMANLMGGGGSGSPGDLDFSKLLSGAGAGGGETPDISALASQLGNADSSNPVDEKDEDEEEESK